MISEMKEFQTWLRTFLSESGFLDLVNELRSRMGLNINDLMCVESMKDCESVEWASLFQIPLDHLKEYVRSITEFNKYTGMITGQWEKDLLAKNDKLNSILYELKETILRSRAEGLVDNRVSVSKCS